MKVIATLVLFAVSLGAHAACSVSDIQIQSMKPRFVDECSRTPCYVLKGVAVLRNRCAEPVGVQIQLTGLNKAGVPVATNAMWPASVQNIAPGDFTFSLDHYLDYDPTITKFTMTVLSVKRWR